MVIGGTYDRLYDRPYTIDPPNNTSEIYDRLSTVRTTGTQER